MKTSLYYSVVLKKTQQEETESNIYSGMMPFPKQWLLLIAIIIKIVCLLTAVCLIRAVTAVQYVVTPLGPVVAGSISTPQHCTLSVICKIKPSTGHGYELKSACSFKLLARKKLCEWKA